MNDERRNDNDTADATAVAGDVTRLEAAAGTVEELAGRFGARAASADTATRDRVALARQRIKIAYDELAGYSDSPGEITEE